MKKIEQNVIIAINAARRVLDIFLGPFLTTYFIKTSSESIVDLSLYHIFAYCFLCVTSYITISIIKNKFKIATFRLGVIVNFIYIMTIIILAENIIKYLWIMAILYAISAAMYWMPYNLFVVDKVKTENRTEFTVKNKIVSSIISILCPIFLGSIITVTNYELTARIILIVSLIQIVLSFMLKPEEKSQYSKFDLKKTWRKINQNNSSKKVLWAELFIGMNAYGAMETVMAILIFNSFKTDLNLGIITSIANVLGIIGVWIYGKVYKNREDKKIIILSCLIPVISMIVLLMHQSNFTVVIYNFCYIIFTGILGVILEIRVCNISNSELIPKGAKPEFILIKELFLAMGRIVGYIFLLISGLSENLTLLYIISFILTLSIWNLGITLRKVEKIKEE